MTNVNPSIQTRTRFKYPAVHGVLSSVVFIGISSRKPFDPEKYITSLVNAALGLLFYKLQVKEALKKNKKK